MTRTLRERASKSVRAKKATVAHTLGTSLAMACLSTGAIAQQQQGADIVLPTVDVETTEAAPRQARVNRPRITAATTCTPSLAGTVACAAEEAAVAEQAAAEAAHAAKARAGGSSFANPDAPFLASESGNSRLPGELKDTARSVTAITQDVLETTGTTSVRQIARTTPGISLGFGEGGNSYGDNLYIRGFKANNDIYKDGIRDPGIGISETFATEQVEVAKGPSGTIGGRGTTGGAMDIISKSPQDVDFTRSVTTITDAGTARQTLDINRVLDDRTQLRFNGMWQDGAVAGRDHVKDDRKGAALALRYKATDNLTIEADVNYTKFEQTSDWGIPYVNDEDLGLVGPVSEFGVDASTWYGIPGRDYQDYQQTSASLKTIWDLDNGFKLTNTLRATGSITDYIVGVPSGMDTNGSTDVNDWDVHISDKSVYQKTDVLADVLELSGDAQLFGRTHKLVVGLSFSDEQIRKWGYTNLTSEDYDPPAGVRGCRTSVVNPDPIGEGCWTGDAPILGDTSTDTSVVSKSFYVLDTVEVNDRLTLNGGLRVDHYDIERSGMDRSGEAYTLSRSDTMFNWNVGATYAASDKLNIYAAAATSTNPMGQEIASGGGFYGGLDEGGEDLAPEENTSFEIGAKYSINPNLLLTAAVFQTSKDNAREDIGPRGGSVTYDTLEYRVRGIELGIAGRVNSRLSLFGGATMMKSKITDSQDADAIGESLPNIAHKQLNLLATYQFTDQLMLGGRLNYQGVKNLGSTYANGLKLPAAWTFDLLGEYEIAGFKTLRFAVTNLTDETVYDAGYRSSEPFTYVAPGREISVTLDMKF
ncbi:TonB-dependent siderophore receptor [Thalassovita sp.]|uniref:TonB-dependent receptor n=1 Tax=Thalassovita sp. TaxID=1979401 RepID=UPI002B277276|nr:TonB-dependent siderophore receptor [Thalassovita sp.]